MTGHCITTEPKLQKTSFGRGYASGNRYDGTRNRQFSGTNSRPYQSRWDRGRDQNRNSFPRNSWRDRSSFNSRRQSPPRRFATTKEACDSSTDRIIPKKLIENPSASSHIKTDNKLPNHDVRHIINRRRNSNSDMEKSTSSTSGTPKSDSQTLAGKGFNANTEPFTASNYIAAEASGNISVKPHSSEETKYTPKAGYPSTSSTKREIVEDADIQETPKQNQALQKHSSAPHNSAKDSSTPITYSTVKKELKKEIKVEDYEINTDFLNEISSEEMYIPTSLFGSPSAPQAKKSSAVSKPSLKSDPIQISVKSVKKINANNESSNLLSGLNESLSSLVESTQSDENSPLTQADLSLSNEDIPSSSTRVRERSATVQTVLEVLSCGECKKWAHSGRVYWCECRLICRSCRKKTDGECSLCGTVYEGGARLVNFHQRLASMIPHPCRYRECTQLVKPGAAHEETCKYAPTKCFKCNKSVATALLRQHFDNVHSRILADKNKDVKFSDFIKVEKAGDCREIICFTHELKIPITLSNICNERSFIVTAPQFKETPSNITVTFEFSELNGWEFKRDAKLRNDLEKGLDTVNVPQNIFQDWRDEKCKLNITCSVSKKRRNGENKPPKKKKKVAN